jgi:hypothetical protein
VCAHTLEFLFGYWFLAVSFNLLSFSTAGLEREGRGRGRGLKRNVGLCKTTKRDEEKEEEVGLHTARNPRCLGQRWVILYVKFKKKEVWKYILNSQEGRNRTEGKKLPTFPRLILILILTSCPASLESGISYVLSHLYS